MHRWHSCSTAICRSASSRDLVRVAQGIEASLRSFHISASRSAEERSSQTSRTPPTRRAAAAKAGEQISRLPINISRVDDGSPGPRQGPGASTGPRVLKRNPNAIAPRGRGGVLVRGGPRGRGGAVRGRGGQNGRGKGQARRGRRRNLGNSGEEVDDFNLPNAVPPAQANAFSILEAHEEHWRTENEINDYTELMEIVEDAHQKNAEATQMLKDAERRNDSDLKAKAEGLLTAVSNNVRQGLYRLVEAQDEVFPNHVPIESQDASKPQGMIGGMPVGREGFGTVVEDALRLIAKREGHLYEEPQKLARKLIDGELVKFTDAYEKLIVTRMANEMAYKEHGPEGIGFEALAPAARGDLVKSIVSGRYEDLAAGVNGTAMKNMARIMGGNATYTAGARSRVLEALSSMLPKERPQTNAKQT